jgi:hypothetical protein
MFGIVNLLSLATYSPYVNLQERLGWSRRGGSQIEPPNRICFVSGGSLSIAASAEVE